MSVSANALTVLEKRYFKKDIHGNPVENVEGMFRRVAKAVSKADEKYVSKVELEKIEQNFYDMMYNLEFLPNSPTLMNAGRPLGQLSACFVLPVEDSMEGIFETIKNAALIHKSGGGTGFSFSRLRAKGAAVNSTGGVASGPISFMKVFNAATEAVKQGGTRRGANMGILRIDHPDIMEFISCKSDNTEITNFNISVGITEEFMNCVEQKRDYELIDPVTKEVVGRLNATQVFNKIVEMAWKNGEPGIIFLDRLNNDNVTPLLGDIESTNPCGEQPLLPYEACNLGSINLSLMIKNDNGQIGIDYDRLERTVKMGVHFLDNVIEVNQYPLPEIDKMTRSTRKIGLGIMGWADLLCKLGISYNSKKAVNLAENIMHFIQKKSREASVELAKVKGVFPEFDKSIYKDLGIKVRNATTTTIAPTGTLSLIAGVSSGIEPIFAISYIRNVMDNNEMVEVNPYFKQIATIDDFYSEDLMKRIAKKGSISNFEEIPKSVRDVFVTSHDVLPESHVEMQAAFQKYTDNAVSKTVNLPHNATQEDVKEVYFNAYKTMCKGVTIYRDGSRDMQVLNIGKVKGKEVANNREEQVEVENNRIFKKEKVESVPINSISHQIEPRNRPDITTGFTEKVRIGCGNLYITVNYDDKGICEVFTNTGRAGGCPSQSEATSRLVSTALRSGIDANSIVEQLKGIRCPSTIRQKGLKVMSCPDAIARVIDKVAKMQGTESKVKIERTRITEEDYALIKPGKGIEVDTDSCESNCSISETCNFSGLDDMEEKIGYCPECSTEIEHEGGCVICRSCGYSKCG